MFSTVVAKTAALTVMKFIGSLATRIFRAQKADSLISFTKATRVEPIALIDNRLVHQLYMPDIMQSLSSIFAGYYLQAVALAVNVGQVNVIRLLDALNPTRDVHDAAATMLVRQIQSPGLLSLEAYRYGLPVPDQKYGLEAFADNDIHDAKNWMDNKSQQNLDRGPHLPKHDAAASMTFKANNEAVNLSVGKLLEVTVEDGGKKATFPITVRLISTIIGSDILAHILGDGSKNISLKERWHSWRAGQLEFVRDLILCQDLIDDHRRTLLKDKSGVYADILARRVANASVAGITDTPSIGSASNLIVISTQTVKELERLVEGKLSNPKVRDAIFSHTYIMIMVVVDTEWEQVTIYHRGISTPTEMSIKELKATNKGTGPDVGEILKAYQLGQNPKF